MRYLIAGLLALTPSLALADTLDKSDSAWILTATALVLFMTLPGLALFYGGLVRNKNVLSVLMQCFAIACAVSLVWLVVGYSLAFSDGGAANAWIGGFSKPTPGSAVSATCSSTASGATRWRAACPRACTVCSR